MIKSPIGLTEATSLTFANIETTIALHLEANAVRLPVDTRLLLAGLRDLAGAQASALRNPPTD